MDFRGDHQQWLCAPRALRQNCFVTFRAQLARGSPHMSSCREDFNWWQQGRCTEGLVQLYRYPLLWKAEGLFPSKSCSREVLLQLASHSISETSVTAVLMEHNCSPERGSLRHERCCSEAMVRLGVLTCQ